MLSQVRERRSPCPITLRKIAPRHSNLRECRHTLRIGEITVVSIFLECVQHSISLCVTAILPPHLRHLVNCLLVLATQVIAPH